MFSLNINGPMSVASPADDLRRFVSVPGAGTRDAPLRTFAGTLLYLGLRGGISTHSELKGVCRQGSSL